MLVNIDKNNYITCAVCDGVILENGIEVNSPLDIDDFWQNFQAYKLENHQLIKDENKLKEILYNENLQNLRLKREKICFPIINRGVLWYNTLTENQKNELNNWYKAWLDVTLTLEEPQIPSWI